MIKVIVGTTPSAGDDADCKEGNGLISFTKASRFAAGTLSIKGISFPSQILEI